MEEDDKEEKRSRNRLYRRKVGVGDFLLLANKTVHIRLIINNGVLKLSEVFISAFPVSDMAC